jgi:hypothetical protein
MNSSAGDDPISISISSPTMLAKLLAVGAGAEGVSDFDELALLLRQQLSLPVSSLAHPGGAPREESFRAVSSVGDALSDDRPQLGALQRIKEHAKSLRVAIPPAVPPEVASVLYYAAILAARVSLGMRVSTLDDATLRQGARWCLAQRWLDEPRRALFARAAAGLDSGEAERGRQPR